MSARLTGAPDAAKDVDSMVARCHRHDEPTQLAEVLRAFNLVGKSLAVGPVVVAVVFHGKHQVFPAHVEVIPSTAVGALHRNLRPRSRKACANHQEPQPRFLWRLCARIHEVQRRLEPAQTACMTMARCPLFHTDDLEIGGLGQRSQTSNRVISTSSGESSSIHFAPYIADAASPATTAS